MMFRRSEQSFTTLIEVEENTMQRFAGFAVLVVGIVLVVWGVNASHSVSSDISRLFTGAVTDKAIYLIVGGTVVLIAGASMAFAGRRRRA